MVLMKTGKSPALAEREDVMRAIPNMCSSLERKARVGGGKKYYTCIL
jgi:hypothetical protein